jgi:glycogen debranching enzyme
MRVLCKHLNLTYYGYGTMEKLFAKEVKKNFFKKGNLLDRAGDDTIRPNVFIAYYVYPELLNKYEWMLVFDKALRCLWLEWGGLSSIDKKHPWFQPNATGHTNHSYHRGDSWYWVNNLAAICMHSLNHKRYQHQIENIYHSSEHEMLNSGFIGHCAEISSASDRKSEGCMAQAWSAALFIELAEKLGGL